MRGPKVESIPGIGGEIGEIVPAAPDARFDTVMVTFSLKDGKPVLSMLSVDDYDRVREVLASVRLNKTIYDYLRLGIDTIDRELLD